MVVRRAHLFAGVRACPPSSMSRSHRRRPRGPTAARRSKHRPSLARGRVAGLERRGDEECMPGGDAGTRQSRSLLEGEMRRDLHPCALRRAPPARRACRRAVRRARSRDAPPTEATVDPRGEERRSHAVADLYARDLIADRDDLACAVGRRHERLRAMSSLRVRRPGHGSSATPRAHVRAHRAGPSAAGAGRSTIRSAAKPSSGWSSYAFMGHLVVAGMSPFGAFTPMGPKYRREKMGAVPISLWDRVVQLSFSS